MLYKTYSCNSVYYSIFEARRKHFATRAVNTSLSAYSGSLTRALIVGLRGLPRPRRMSFLTEGVLILAEHNLHDRALMWRISASSILG